MSRITTTSIASSLLLCASFWASMDAADTFTDLRASYQLAIVDDYDESERISVMLIGPLCSIFPVGCGTPSRVGSSPAAASDSFDGYEHVLLDGGSSTLDPLFSIELVQGTYEDSNTNDEVSTLGINLGIALGWEIGCCSENRWQIETGIYAGFGLSEHDDGTFDDENILYYDYGLRLGTHYTWGFGLQVGFDARFEGMSFDDANIPAQIAPSSATTYALSVGYRF